MQSRNQNVIFLGPLSSIKELNFGIFLVGAFFLFEFGSLPGLYPFIGDLKLPFIVSLLCVIYALYLLFNKKVDFKTDTTKRFLLLCGYILIYTIISTKIPLFRDELIKLFIIYMALYIVIVSSVKKPSQFILLINIWLFSIMFSSFHGIRQGGLIWGNRWLNDENQIALVAATAIPFAFIFFRQYKNKAMLVFYLACLGFFISMNVVAASRGGALSMFIVAFLLWILSQNKMRILIMFLFAVVLVLNYAPEHFFNEMQTLEQGTEESTADDRIYLWGMGFKMFNESPFFGVGPLNYPAEFSKYEQGERYSIGVMRVPHSTPVQWFAEMGIFGTFLLMMLFKALYENWKIAFTLKKHINYHASKDELSIFVNVSHACAIAQIGFWFGALFLSLLEFPFYWCLIPFSEAWKNMTLEQIKILNEQAE